jgi:NADPH:quinone reductase
MRAIVIEKFGGPESLVYTELPEPEPGAGYVAIQIKAVGINQRPSVWPRGTRLRSVETRESL